MNKENIIKIKEGKLFPFFLVATAYAFMLVLLLMCLEVFELEYDVVKIINSCGSRCKLGILLTLLIFGFFTFAQSGITFNTIEKKYKNYFLFYFFLRFGKWKSYEDYPFVAVIKSTQATLVGKNNYYSIVLLNKSHLKKISIKKYPTREEANNKLKVWAENLNVETTHFKPQGGIIL